MEVGNHMDKATTDKIVDLCLQQLQLDKGMPVLKPLEPELERLIIGNG